MGGQSTELTGPDFKKGVSVKELPEAGTLLGHADGEAVVLVTRGKEHFAVGASCTHYGGPLAEGIVEGDSIRCPWHHARFNLETGAPHAPALNPIPCWEVQERDGKVFVVRKKSIEPRKKISVPNKILIIGAGAAGNAAAEALRGEGFSGSITLIGEDPSVPYDRPNLSKDYLAGTAPEEWIPLRPKEFYQEQKIDAQFGVSVAAIDPRAKIATLSNGKKIEFDRCLLATGATPVKLPIPGGDSPSVHYLRTLADSRAIIERATSARTAVVIGSSFIGLEVAASLRARKIEVRVVGPDSVPLARVMGEELGSFIQRLHESHGVIFHLNQSIVAIENDTVKLKSGESLKADLIIAGIGVLPSVTLAKDAGIKVERGVLVDRYLETSAKDIFAAGDIARWPDPITGNPIRVEHWVVAERQGQVAARNLLGKKVAFEEAPFFWSQHYDVRLAYVGYGADWDEIKVSGKIEEKNCSVFFIKQGKVTAVASMGRDQQNLEFEADMEKRRPVAPG